jgi:hypothetical protein
MPDEACKTCWFYRLVDSDAAGECRRFPPNRPGNFPDEPWRYPVVAEASLCGEYTKTRGVDC